MEWTEESIQRLRALWQEGHSTAEIGRRMSISKNAVVGKAHRLTLPARPSPIRRQPVLRNEPRQRGAASPSETAAMPRDISAPGPAVSNVVRLHPPSADKAAAPERKSPPPTPPVAFQQPAPAKAPSRPVTEAPPQRAAYSPAPRSRAASCCWPIGEPGTKSFRFCCAEPMAGKPYCGEHAQLAYVKIKDRRDSVA